MNNRQFASSASFVRACANLSVVPTKRQASKFRNRKGLLWRRNGPLVD